MSLSILRTVHQLKQKVASLGYELPNLSGRAKKEPLIKILQDHYLNEMDYVHPSLPLMLELGTPMLCSRLNQLDVKEQEEIWDDDNVFFELKEDGHRNLLFVIDGHIEHYSRHLSVQNYLPISYGDKIWMPVDHTQLKNNFILDTEIISTNASINTILAKKGVITETQLEAVSALLQLNAEDSLYLQQKYGCPLKLQVFDCVWWEGEWLINLPLSERRDYLSRAYSQLKKAGANVSVLPCSRTAKRDFYKRVIDRKMEGVVAKRIDSIYVPNGFRGHKSWIKIKGFMQERLQILGMSDTIEGFVTGFIAGKKGSGWENLVGALKLSVLIDDGAGNQYEHWVATPSNLTFQERSEMTELTPKGPQLKREYYDKIYEFNGQSVSSRSRRFNHATIIRERKDKTKLDCVYPESMITNFIL